MSGANEAVRLAGRALVVTNRKNPSMLDTLATAYAAAGRFNLAIAVEEDAAALASALRADALADEIRGRLELFRQGRPYRQDTLKQKRNEAWGGD
ncbi:MAG: hypothetical protein JSU94_10075 [Phycisphaerales bacterium]|nr:MAG: hypothetical protein JSU94_10075 [Phycisphaerales bacterium]